MVSSAIAAPLFDRLEANPRIRLPPLLENSDELPKGFSGAAAGYSSAWVLRQPLRKSP